MKFSRFAETIQLKNNNHVVSVTVTLKISDCNGIIYFTDLQLQDGDQLTGYTVHTSKMLTKMQENGQVGVEIVIEYEDGTTETRFIDLI